MSMQLSNLTNVQIHDQEEELSWLSQLKHLSTSTYGRQMHPQAGNMRICGLCLTASVYIGGCEAHISCPS